MPTSTPVGASPRECRCTVGSGTCRANRSRLLPERLLISDVRRNRDGVNYGVGLRYDVNTVLGLRLEYARYGRLAGETMTGVLPDSDQVQFGLQFRF